ncbi:unnamed protein product, partial [Nesidiocoris tenuis]
MGTHVRMKMDLLRQSSKIDPATSYSFHLYKPLRGNVRLEKLFLNTWRSPVVVKMR